MGVFIYDAEIFIFYIMNEKTIELVKWFISSVVIVFATLFVESMFKDREVGIEEMKIYNQYVDIILKSDNIEQRWKLAEYFSVVTPTKRLRERWVDYQNVLSEDYQKYKGLTESEEQVLSHEDFAMDSIVVLQQQKAEIGGPLVSNLFAAEQNEQYGFEALMNKDLSSAIECFKKSEDFYHGYHQVYEIYLYLLRNRAKITSEENWDEVYKEIVTKYSWKMPQEFKSKLSSY
jgi:hypothetical protein